jgi:DNA-binding transcriptional ArsR family regulator
MRKDKTIVELQSDMCKALSSPKRIEILNALKDSEKSVSELVEILGVPKANVSQHLAVMRYKGILKARREENNIYYSVSSQKVIATCFLMREILLEHMKEKGNFAKIASR